MSTPEIFETARTLARERMQEWWSRWNFNMWQDFDANPRQLSTTWVDPFFEQEIGAPTNEAPDWKIWQNAYLVYCWLSYKGYKKYAMVGMMTSFLLESSITGGAWENRLKPYASIEQFDPTSLASAQGRTWYTASNTPVSWTATATAINPDTNQRETLTKSAQPGSWAAYKKYPIKVVDGYFVLENGQPVWDTANPGYRGAGTGYGLAQFTAFTKLPSWINQLYQRGHPQLEDGNKHWQLNVILTLMMIEAQRSIADQIPYEPLSEWDGDNAGYPSGIGITGGILYGTHRFQYGFPGASAMTWEYYAADGWYNSSDPYLNNVLTYINTNYRQQNPIDPDSDEWAWYIRQFAISIWQVCYEKGFYDYQHLPEHSLDIYNAIDYWDSHPLPGLTTGWDVADIPRPRDIPYSELERYHLNPALLFPLRRKNKNVRTILL